MTRPEIHIRHAESTDADQWRSLRCALWPEQEPAALAADVTRFFTTPRRGPGTMPEAALVAVEDGPTPSLVGFVELSRRLYAEGCETSPVGFLEGWYVAPGHRRRGIGRALVAAAESWARGHGCREFASDALAENSVSAAAHRALGFEEVEIIRCFRKSLTHAEAGSPLPPPRPRLPLEVLPDVLAVCRLPAGAALPTWTLAPGPFVTISRTAEELSITVTQASVPPDARCERDYRALRVRGPLPFNLIGIVAAIAEPLAEAGLSIFAISTFDTDHILVKARDLEAAVTTLEDAGHRVDRCE